MTRGRLEVIHNIPAPYRLHMFRVLNQISAQYDWSFFVHFMALTEPRREHWESSPEALSFPHRFWPDRGFIARGKAWHLNPGMMASVSRSAPSALLVNGPWDSITSALASLLSRPAHQARIGWMELNLSSPGQTGLVAHSIKSGLLNRYTHFAAPGEEGRIAITRFAGEERDILTLPNIVDETRFILSRARRDQARKALRRQFGWTDQQRVAVWPARLAPAKGLVEFLAAIDPQSLDGWRLLIVGSGPLEREIGGTIERLRLGVTVRLAGLIDYDRMPDVYNGADLFLLPSQHDPNPLSVVEALFSGLPILISKQVGNFREALEAGVNGWACDARAPDTMREAAKAAFGATPDQLTAFGAESVKRAERFWSSIRTMGHFVGRIVDAHEALASGARLPRHQVR